MHFFQLERPTTTHTATLAYPAMAGEAAALLDELMGRTRNVIPGKEVRETEWSDVEVHQVSQSKTRVYFLATVFTGLQELPVWILSL